MMSLLFTFVGATAVAAEDMVYSKIVLSRYKAHENAQHPSTLSR
jgi:hypothetical protein